MLINSLLDWTCSSSTELTWTVSEVLLIFLCRRLPATNIVLVLDLLSTILLSVVHCATLPYSIMVVGGPENLQNLSLHHSHLPFTSKVKQQYCPTKCIKEY